MTRGGTGYLPDYYSLVQSARYLGVSPWDLMEQPAAWLRIAQICETAELKARKELESRGL